LHCIALRCIASHRISSYHIMPYHIILQRSDCFLISYLIKCFDCIELVRFFPVSCIRIRCPLKSRLSDGFLHFITIGSNRQNFGPSIDHKCFAVSCDRLIAKLQK